MDVDLFSSNGELRHIARLGAQAEQHGLPGLVIAESGHNALLACAAVAATTTSLDIGTGVAVAFPRSPMVTAAAAWQLAQATGGRFHLGLGTQVEAHVTRRFSAPFAPPGPRMREYIQSLRAIFAAFQGTEKLHFEGEYYRFSLLPSAWSPGPIEHPDVPILVAAVGPWMLRMAGQYADGVHVHPLHSTRYITEVLQPALAEGAAAAGRDPAGLRLVVPVFTVVGDSPEEQAPWRERARQQVAFYGSTKNYAHQFELLGYEGLSAALNERMKAGDNDGFLALIDDDLLDHFAVCCRWDELADRLAERYGGLADRLLLYFGERMCERDPANWGRLSEVARALRTSV